MYVVLVKHPTIPVLYELLPIIKSNFPTDSFSIHGSEEKGYQFRIDGAGCEKLPRIFAKAFIKNWKPSLEMPV